MRVLLIDTCGEVSGVALARGDICGHMDLPSRVASAEILVAIREMLANDGWTLSELDAVGVVGGPGAFTGVRTGLAAAKGLCESANLRLAVVSRLEVLVDAAALRNGLAALDAGRGELYVRDADSGREWLCAVDELPIASGSIVVAEQRVAERLAVRQPVLRPLQVSDALPVVLRCLADGGSDGIFAEANYVRGEQNIYAKPASMATPREPH